MDEEDDLLALIVASLEETAKIAAAAHDAADAARQAALETKTQLLARMSGLETSLATFTQQSRDRAAALEKKVEAVTTMLKAMKGSAMPGAVLVFFSASRSAPPCSTGSPPWQASATELGAAPAVTRAPRCDIVLARRFGVFVLMLAARVSPAGCPEAWRPGIEVAPKHLAC
jgi:hypothetical protein